MQHLEFVVVALALVAAVPAAAQKVQRTAPTECIVTSQLPEPADTYEAYCGRCHQADELARQWFGPPGRADPNKTDELALFLDRQSACPQAQHEEIARWLAELAGSKN